jgi:hypothetical protein
MSDDRFFERLREDARPLRYEPDDFMITRITARVQERISVQSSVAGMLAGWFRPLATSMAALALAAGLGLAWIGQSAPQATPTAVESLAASNSVEIAVAGDVYSVNNE